MKKIYSNANQSCYKSVEKYEHTFCFPSLLVAQFQPLQKFMHQTFLETSD